MASMRNHLRHIAAAAAATAVVTVVVSLARTGTFVMDRVEVPGGREIPSAYFPVALAAGFIAVVAGGAALLARARPR